MKSEIGQIDLETINKTFINEKSWFNNDFISFHLKGFVILNSIKRREKTVNENRNTEKKKLILKIN